MSVLCQSLNVSRSAYYVWRQGVIWSRQRGDHRLRPVIRGIFREHRRRPRGAADRGGAGGPRPASGGEALRPASRWSADARDEDERPRGRKGDSRLHPLLQHPKTPFGTGLLDARSPRNDDLSGSACGAMILQESVRPSCASLGLQARRRQGAARCQVSISTCSATRSAWKTCSTSFDSKPQADREANCMAPVPSTAQRPQAAERSRSTWPTDATTATSATAAATNSNSGRQSTSSLCTTLPWTYGTPWPVKSPGFIAGDAPLPIGTTEKKRHRYFEPSGNVTFPHHRKHFNCPSNWSHLILSR